MSITSQNTENGRNTQDAPGAAGTDGVGFDTRSLHAGYDPTGHLDATSVPIYATAAYDLHTAERGSRTANGKEPGAHLYSRASNPTSDVLEARLASLDGGKAAVAFASGMAAIAATILTLADNGGRIVAANALYGGTFDFITNILPALGIGVDIIDRIDDPASLEAAIGPDTRLVFVESVSNPTTRIADIDAISRVAHAHGVAVVVDNTLPTPYLYRPIEHGADIVVYSTTKGINGHGNALGGAVIDAADLDYGPANTVTRPDGTDAPRYPQLNSPVHNISDEAHGIRRSFVDAAGTKAFSQRLRLKYLRLLGAAPAPFETYLTLQGLETLGVRLDRETATTQRIARFLEKHPHVINVAYAGLPDSPDHALAQRDYPRGVGTVLAFTLEGGIEQSNAFIDATRIFTYLTNIGASASLIVDPARTTHREFTEAQQRAAGIEPTTIRLSIGLEDPDDLIADLERGFTAAYGA
ncbi:O-acetylhomoserine aminocarboxypropyltransferase/cysteine synthase family protein [Pseudoscardovia radai]|uniref:O-acetylhomoserine aminocarboxypropyltransferase/cysteine synthase family protein n=1 Tax=Pseudoscardovia radai TaxID=987066 RepID=UPI0039964F4B